MKIKSNKQELLKKQDYAFYRLLETIAKYEPNRWVSKEELLEMLSDHFKKDEGTHDICAEFNVSRLRLNQARSMGIITHLVLLKSHKFKLATTRDEVEKYCKRDKDNGLKLLKRYWQNIGVLKQDGQGKLIDCNGNVIDEESLAKRFNKPFDYE